MALLFMEGFDGYTNLQEVLSRRGMTYEGNNPESWGDIQTGRISGKCVEFGYHTNYEYTLDSATTATTWFNFALNVPSFATAINQRLFHVIDVDGAVIWSVDVNKDTKQLRVLRGTTTVLGTSTASLQNATWESIGAEVLVSNTVGTVKLWINGTLEIDLTGQDTQPNTTTTGYKIRFGTSATQSADYRMDDVIFGDDSGSDLTTYPGDCHIEMVLPDSDGATNDFTAVGAGTTNADRVDENPTDDDTTYVHSATATHKDLYGFAALTETADTYLAVQLHLRARKEGTGYREVNGTMRSNVTEVDGANTNLLIDYTWFTYLQENDPNGGINWTESAINAMQAGIEIQT